MVRVISMYFRGQDLDGKGNICTTGDRILMVRVISVLQGAGS